MKTDRQLREDIVDELMWEPSVNESEIGVAVNEGIVTLTGHVETYAQKYAAERAVERVTGVRALAEDLQVRLPTSLERDDTDIAHSVIKALDWDVEVPTDAIRAKVERGWVRLEGTVEWQYQKGAAERAVRYLTGVRGVTNALTVKPRSVSPLEVSEKIRDALRRSADVDASGIAVESMDGSVTLRGRVRTWAEREDAERAAWSAPGVTSVNDLLAVG